MPNWLVEILYILAQSKRTQWAIILGVIFFFGIHLYGEHALANLEARGGISGLKDILIHKIAKRYDKLAWFTLISFWILAFKLYQKDKKRYW